MQRYGRPKFTDAPRQHYPTAALAAEACRRQSSQQADVRYRVYALAAAGEARGNAQSSATCVTESMPPQPHEASRCKSTGAYTVRSVHTPFAASARSMRVAGGGCSLPTPQLVSPYTQHVTRLEMQRFTTDILTPIHVESRTVAHGLISPRC